MITTDSCPPDPRPPVLITGGSGTLGRAFARMCAERDLSHHALFRNDLDIADEAHVERMLDRLQPWAIINAAGYVRVDDAERDADRCFRENTHGAECLAAACARRGIRFVTFSTDLVFDGHKRAPYVEDDTPAPLNVYGRSKADAEVRVLERHPDALVVRTSAFFGPWDEYNFVSIALRHLRGGEVLEAAEDMFVSPTYVPDLVNVCLDLVIDGERGLCHLTNGDPVSWAEFAVRAAESAQVDAGSLRRTTMRSMRTAAARPSYSVLRTTPRYAMPALDDALRRFVADAAPT